MCRKDWVRWVLIQVHQASVVGRVEVFPRGSTHSAFRPLSAADRDSLPEFAETHSVALGMLLSDSSLCNHRHPHTCQALLYRPSCHRMITRSILACLADPSPYRADWGRTSFLGCI